MTDQARPDGELERVARAISDANWRDGADPAFLDKQFNDETLRPLFLKQARAAIASLSERIAPQPDTEKAQIVAWQPIGNATKDETPRLLWQAGGTTPVIGYWSSWNNFWTNGESDRMRDHVPLWHVTHWQPLPASPVDHLASLTPSKEGE